MQLILVGPKRKHVYVPKGWFLVNISACLPDYTLGERLQHIVEHQQKPTFVYGDKLLDTEEFKWYKPKEDFFKDVDGKYIQIPVNCVDILIRHNETMKLYPVPYYMDEDATFFYNPENGLFVQEK